MNPNCDENCYFIEAKRIRISFRNKINGQLEKKEVTVHQECLKQLETLKQQKSKEVGKKRSAENILERPKLESKKLKVDENLLKGLQQ